MFYANSVFRNSAREHELETDFVEASLRYVAAPFWHDCRGAAMEISESLHEALSWAAWRAAGANGDKGNVFVHRGFAVAVSYDIERKALRGSVLNAYRASIVRYAPTFEELREAIELSIDAFISIYEGSETDLIDYTWDDYVLAQVHPDIWPSLLEKMDERRPLDCKPEYKGYTACLHYCDTSNHWHRGLTGTVTGVKDELYFWPKSLKDSDRAMHDAIEDYLVQCEQRGIAPETPDSNRYFIIDGYEMDVTFCNETGQLEVRGRSPIGPYYDLFYFEAEHADEIPELLEQEVKRLELNE